MARLFAFIISGLATLLLGVGSCLATVSPPSDDVAKAHYIDGLIALTFIAIVSLVALAVIEFKLDRERKHREAQRDEQYDERHRELLDSIARTAPHQTATAGTTPPKTLREAGFELVKDIRAFLNRVPQGSMDEEFEHIFQPFLENFWPRLRDIKDRYENVLPRNSVMSSTEWLPTSRDRVTHTLEALERETLRIPQDIPW